MLAPIANCAFLSKELCLGRKIESSCSTAGASERFPVRLTSAAVTPQVRLCSSGCLPAEVSGRGLGAQSAPLLGRGGTSCTFALRRPLSCTVDLLHNMLLTSRRGWSELACVDVMYYPPDRIKAFYSLSCLTSAAISGSRFPACLSPVQNRLSVDATS